MRAKNKSTPIFLVLLLSSIALVSCKENQTTQDPKSSTKSNANTNSKINAKSSTNTDKNAQTEKGKEKLTAQKTDDKTNQNGDENSKKISFFEAIKNKLFGKKENSTDPSAKTAEKQAQKVDVEAFRIKGTPLKSKTELPGRITAYRIAEIRPQVNGTILRREFTESSNVKAGQSLYQIDPAIYQATYNNAVASLEGARSSANLAHLTAKRMRSLIDSNAVSKQEYDNAVAQAELADSQVKMAEATLNSAKVNLDYTKVESPISGYVGKSNVTEGALVSAGQATPLALVQQLDPIYVDMTQSIDEYGITQREIQSGYISPSKETEVEIMFNDGSIYSEKGKMDFTDLNVDETMGTVSLRATFPNPKRELLPGMFIKPQIIYGVIEDAILIPQRALTRTNQGGAIVKVINSKTKIIELRPVEPIKVVDNSYWLIKSGLQNGELIVLNNITIMPNAKFIANVIKEETLNEPSKIKETNNDANKPQ